jgi:hypothetical protein
MCVGIWRKSAKWAVLGLRGLYSYKTYPSYKSYIGAPLRSWDSWTIFRKVGYRNFRFFEIHAATIDHTIVSFFLFPLVSLTVLPRETHGAVIVRARRIGGTEGGWGAGGVGWWLRPAKLGLGCEVQVSGVREPLMFARPRRKERVEAVGGPATQARRRGRRLGRAGRAVGRWQVVGVRGQFGLGRAG